MNDDPRHLTADAPALMRLRTRQLLLVAALDRERHLGRAAASLAISQPAATRLLQELQQALGSQLFERQARGMEVTPAGEVVVRFARQTLNAFGAVRKTLAALDAGMSGTLRVGSVPSAVPPLLAPALASFKARHPSVELAIDVATSDRALIKLEQGEVDLVLGRVIEARDAEAYEVVPILDEPQAIVARASHPLLNADQAPPSLHDTARWPWVVQPPGTPQASRFIAMMREAGILHRIDVTETDSTIATTALLEASDMLAIMPVSLAAHYARLGLLKQLPIDLPMQVPVICLLWRRFPDLTPVARAFRDTVLEFGQSKRTGEPPSTGRRRLTRPSERPEHDDGHDGGRKRRGK